MVGHFPLQKWLGISLQKVAGHILTKVAKCFLLKILGWALLKYLGWPLLLQKAGPGRIFSLLTLAPSSQHLGKQSRAKGVEVRREGQAQHPNIWSSHTTHLGGWSMDGKPTQGAQGSTRCQDEISEVKAQATDSSPRFLEISDATHPSTHIPFKPKFETWWWHTPYSKKKKDQKFLPSAALVEMKETGLQQFP
ncbi:unnamed protein product [Prunus armeniaca]